MQEKVAKNYNKNFTDPPQLEGYYFSPERARWARNNGKLLSLRIEPSFKCNLNCKYCYNKKFQNLPDEVSYYQLKDIIFQARDLGAESVVNIGGGEPTIYPKFKELTELINSLGMIPVIFTNMQSMTKDLAKFLFKNNVSVIIKFDSLDENIQDFMTGVNGSYLNIRQGFSNLLEAGYGKVINKVNFKLGASFVVNKKNSQEVMSLWKFCRERNIFPNLEMMTPNDSEDMDSLILTSEEWKDIKTKLLDFDRKEYGYDWIPYTPLVGCGCFQVMYSLYITAQGFVRPCAAIEVDYANIKKYGLREIIRMPFYSMARGVDKILNGKCKNCEHISKCIGCRGMAFSVGVNNGMEPFAALCKEDPSCFKDI